ncbi:MAG: hypothetical protein ACFFG0_27320 [Candidatus Thorarchaeota archaeon]
MNKKEKYFIELNKIIRDFLDINDERLLVGYFINNSNLPGRRANLELANAFADNSAEFKESSSKKLWDLCLFLISFTPDKAPSNDPKEFLSFCGTWAIGAIGASNPKYYHESLNILKKQSEDNRWRVREAVALGLQKLLMKHPDKTLTKIREWIEDTNWLTMRAVVAGVAHLSVLVNNNISKNALQIHELIFSKIISCTNFSSEEFKILKKGLSYTLSVIVLANPDEGFKFLSDYINTENKYIQMILRDNLKKNRLTKNFPRAVTSISQILNEQLRKGNIR